MYFLKLKIYVPPVLCARAVGRHHVTFGEKGGKTVVSCGYDVKSDRVGGCGGYASLWRR